MEDTPEGGEGGAEGKDSEGRGSEDREGQERPSRAGSRDPMAAAGSGSGTGRRRKGTSRRRRRAVAGDGLPAAAADVHPWGGRRGVGGGDEGRGDRRVWA